MAKHGVVCDGCRRLGLKQVSVEATQLETYGVYVFPWVGAGAWWNGKPRVDQVLALDVWVAVIIKAVKVAVKVFAYDQFVAWLCGCRCNNIKHSLLCCCCCCNSAGADLLFSFDSIQFFLRVYTIRT